jgi:hypothetical protein
VSGMKAAQGQLFDVGNVDDITPSHFCAKT